MRAYTLITFIYTNKNQLSQAKRQYIYHGGAEKVFNDKNASRLQSLEIQYKVETARREAEIHQLRNIELEREIQERKKAEKELQRLAITDELTGLYNRRYFFERADYEIKRSIRSNNHLTIVMIDVDKFKHINDTYGHTAGDHALSICGRIFKENLREIDLVARFGGDEFTILLPDTDCIKTIEIMERIRKRLSTPVSIDQASLTLKISVGIACLNINRQQRDTLDKLIERADRALYRAKNTGRDRICSE